MFLTQYQSFKLLLLLLFQVMNSDNPNPAQVDSKILQYCYDACPLSRALLKHKLIFICNTCIRLIFYDKTSKKDNI